MVRRLLTASAIAGLLLGGSTGCLFVEKKPNRAQRASKSKQCKPSQYWDGNQCRHKGKGKGARKHDGR